jgi:hypothetical protein
MILASVTGIIALGACCGVLVGAAIAFVLRRRRAAKATALRFTTKFMYSGNLKQTNLLDAIQFLELGRREGVLHIYVGRRKGYITFVAGQIVDAFFRDIIGKEAIFQMLELEYGDFSFESKVVNQPRVITETMMDIALEWDARRYGGAFGGDEQTPPAEEVPSGDGAPAADEGAAPAEGPLPQEQLPDASAQEGYAQAGADGTEDAADFSQEPKDSRSQDT